MCEELLLDFDQIAEWNTAPEASGSNHKVCKTASTRIGGGMVRRCIGDVMDIVLVVGVCQLLGCPVIDFGQNERSKRGSLRGSRSSMF